MDYVYFLKEWHGRLYVGSTNNLKRRLEEHKKDKSGFKLLAYIAVENESKARELEKYFKTGSGRAILKKRILTDEALA
ncbi:MAG: GIY-YIG nuclease family protein [Candidatus Omnitrophica bacterium]|nr:GIY-YIG nuclease family protein [Candidatus Omnitrophota bacterium]